MTRSGKRDQKLKQDLLAGCDRLEKALRRFKNHALTLCPGVKDERDSAHAYADDCSWAGDLLKMTLRNYEADVVDTRLAGKRPQHTWYESEHGILACCECERRLSECACKGGVQ